jgi:subtilase family serine protease
LTILKQADNPEHLIEDKPASNSRLQTPTKGRDLHTPSMHTKVNFLNALSLSVLLSLLCLSESLFAQGPLRDRIVNAVDSSQIAAVAGTVHPLARTGSDQGRVDSLMSMHVTMTFKMTAAQRADLDALLAAQQQRGSPDYQRWLSPEQFGSRFGLSQSDITKVTGWLESQGFHVENVPASRNMITFSGTAQQVESALHTEMHRYLVNGKEHFANSVDPSIPAALADVVMGFRGLNNFELKPKALRKMNPKFTSSVSRNHFITPPDFATIYDVNQLYQRNFTGTGQKIAVVGQSNINVNDVVAFRSNSGLAQKGAPNGPCPGASCPVQVVIVPGDTDPGMVSGDIDEANLDVEWAGAIAYNATVIFIVGGNPNAGGGGVMDAINYAITTSPIPAPIISTSYGDCEPDFSSTDISSLQALMNQANAEGITVLGPSGDNGAADCDFSTNPNGPPVTASTKGLAVDLPGALPSVTSVGGTEFTEGADPLGIYWIPAVGTDVVSSARMYIPETAWNDTGVPPQGTTTPLGLSAGGGGSSSVIPKPAWQAGTGVPNDTARDVPDVSFSASSIHDAYLICSENFANNTFSPTCVSPFGFRDSAGGNLAAVGGTSVGPPVMASIVALINESINKSGLGNINAVLYPLAAHSPTAFHDITTGNNQVPFSPPCVASTQIGYTAHQGYDLATGLGSIDAFVLVTNWTAVSPASTANASTSADFSLALASTQLSVKRGTCGSGTLMLTQLNGFTGTPRFTCTVPATLGSTTCAVAPGVGTAFDLPRDYRHIGWWGLLAVLLAGAAFLLVSVGRFEQSDAKLRAWPRLVPGFGIVTVLAIMAGCGGSSKMSGTTNPIVNYNFAVQVPSTAPVASGTLTVTAAIGSLSHNVQITLNTQ